MIISHEYMMLEAYLQEGLLKLHSTKAEAQKHAADIGWDKECVVRVVRRFEQGWLVAQHSTLEVTGMKFDVYKSPAEKYSTNDGEKQIIFVEYKKLLENCNASVINPPTGHTEETDIWIDEVQKPDYIDRLKAALASSKVSQRQFANRCQCSPSRISALLNKRYSEQTPKYIWKTAKALLGDF